MALSRIDLDAVGRRFSDHRDSKSEKLEPRPTINLFELWEEGAQLGKLASARDYRFPPSLVVFLCLAFKL